MIVWLRGDEISMPNGLCIEGDRLLVGNSGDGTIKRVDLTTRSIAVVAAAGSGIDGLRNYVKHGYIVSDWKGKTSLLSGNDESIVLVDTTEEGINAADLEFIDEEQLLVIPTFYDDRVVAYSVRKR